MVLIILEYVCFFNDSERYYWECVVVFSFRSQSWIFSFTRAVDENLLNFRDEGPLGSLSVPLILLLCSSGFPTLRLYTNGIPTEASYEGSRSAEAIVAYVKRSMVPPIAEFATESDLTKFVKSVNDNSPIFVGFGLAASALEDLARKHKRRAYFAAIQDVSDKLMVDFDFDKAPALVGLHPKLDEQAVFYGPFEGMQQMNR